MDMMRFTKPKTYFSKLRQYKKKTEQEFILTRKKARGVSMKQGHIFWVIFTAVLIFMMSHPGFPIQSMTNEKEFDSIEFMETIQTSFNYQMQECFSGMYMGNLGINQFKNESKRKTN